MLNIFTNSEQPQYLNLPFEQPIALLSVALLDTVAVCGAWTSLGLQLEPGPDLLLAGCFSDLVLKTIVLLKTFARTYFWFIIQHLAIPGFSVTAVVRYRLQYSMVGELSCLLQ